MRYSEFCTRCGKGVSAEANFCPWCGRPVDHTETTAETPESQPKSFRDRIETKAVDAA